MARDAQQAGDRVATEYYLQHADHYFRVLNDGRARADEPRQARRPYDGPDDDDYDDAEQLDGRAHQADEAAARPAPNEAALSTERTRGRPPRRLASPRTEAEDEPLPSDGEAALMAFGGLEPELRPAAAEIEDAPPPRRRGRPRKVQPTLVDTP